MLCSTLFQLQLILFSHNIFFCRKKTTFFPCFPTLFMKVDQASIKKVKLMVYGVKQRGKEENKCEQASYVFFCTASEVKEQKPSKKKFHNVQLSFHNVCITSRVFLYFKSHACNFFQNNAKKHFFGFGVQSFRK